MPPRGGGHHAKACELGQGVRKGGSSGLLHKMAVLKELELEEEASAVSEEIREMLTASKECAEGEAGDSVKYEQAAQVVKKRWLRARVAPKISSSGAAARRAMEAPRPALER
eukprot:jgi/Chrpa1/27813/Chrysochromulina_OHIO_Genome00027871-RA